MSQHARARVVAPARVIPTAPSASKDRSSVVPLRVERASRRSATPTISVVLPARNEAANLPWVFAHLPPTVDEVVLVDGSSTDGTRALARQLRPDVRIIEQHRPGKGLAVAMGLRAATCDVVVMLDADCSMDPREIPAFVGALVAGADVAKGSRYRSGGGSGDLTLPRRVGNAWLVRIANVLFRQQWSELCYGYAAMWRDVAGHLVTVDLEQCDRGGRRRPAFGHGFEIEALLFCRAARTGLRVVEVASVERPRKYGASNLRPVRDGTRVLRAMTREYRSRARLGVAGTA